MLAVTDAKHTDSWLEARHRRVHIYNTWPLCCIYGPWFTR